ncbi:MAG: hypothetical protein BWY77_01246 [bacterium ADurb.Bin431]|nr:MAG: hypothetical protein BWY77_01246 [bacterium ADurb.Bin431]HOH08377.1 hypothetical protein [bacterium]
MKRSFFTLFLAAGLCSAAAAAEPRLEPARFFPAPLPLIAADEAAPQAASGLDEKSRGKALMLSFLLPGLGEHYAGAGTKAKIFLGTEISLWLGYAGFLTWSDWRHDEMESYAARHAGVNPAGKSDTYYANIGNYDTIQQYNEAKLRQRNLNDYYRDLDAWHWEWDSAANRERFDQLRISSDKARNRGTFVLGAILANHLISAIDAVWSVNRYNDSQASRVEWNLQFGDSRIQPHLLLSMQRHF